MFFKKMAHFLLFLICLGQLARALETAPQEAVVMPTVSLFDKTHQMLSSSILTATNRVDSFFGTERADDFANGSRLRLFWDLSKSEGASWENQGNAKFHLVLPSLQKLLKYTWQRDTPNENKKDPINKGLPKTPEQAKKSKLLKVAHELTQWRLRLDTGVQVSFPPNPFAQSRLERSIFFLKDFEFQMRESVFWFYREGFGETTSMTLNRAFSPLHLFQLSQDLTWLDDTDTFEYVAGPSFYNTFTDHRALSYNFRVIGTSRPLFYIHSYEAFVAYRHLFHQTWFFGEIIPKLTWPKSNRWKRVASIFFRLEMVFGD